jgi:predicted ester cyclase
MPLPLAQLRDFATRYTAAWCSQNPEAVASFFSTNGSLKINDAAPSVGRSALTEAARSFMTAFPDLKISMNDVISRGPRVEYHWTLEGTNSGTGKKVCISGYEEWLFNEGGLIEDSLGHFDATDYQRQLQHGHPASVKQSPRF